MQSRGENYAQAQEVRITEEDLKPTQFKHIGGNVVKEKETALACAPHEVGPWSYSVLTRTKIMIPIRYNKKFCSLLDSKE